MEEVTKSCCKVPQLLGQFKLEERNFLTNCSSLNELFEQTRAIPLNIRNIIDAVLDIELRNKEICRQIGFEVEASFVRKGRTQRGFGWHVDFSSKGRLKRLYIMSNIFPTEILLNEVNLSELENYGATLDEEVEALEQQIIFTPPENELVLIDGLTAHRSPTVEIDCRRVFFRIGIL